MHLRLARVLTIPASVTLLSTFSMKPPAWMVPPAPGAASSAPTELKPPVFSFEKPVPKELPKIVAVDRRIAGKVDKLRPCVKRRLARAAARLPEGVTLLVTSAHRTHAEQRALRSTFGVKARAGKSTHEDGRAVDVNVLVDGERIRVRTQHKVIGDAMASEGFRYLGPADPVHYSVPKEKIDAEVQTAPDLDLMTWREMEDLQAEIEKANSTKVAAVEESAAAP